MLRDKQIIYGKKDELRKLIKAAKKEGDSFMASWWQRELDKLSADCLAIKRYGSEVKPMRTPWKGMVGGYSRKNLL